MTGAFFRVSPGPSHVNVVAVELDVDGADPLVDPREPLRLPEQPLQPRRPPYGHETGV